MKSDDLTKNVVTTEPNKTKLANGLEMYQYQHIYQYNFDVIGDPVQKGLTAIAIDAGLKYYLTYNADSDVFDRYIPIIKTMIYSFEPITFEFS